MFEVIRPPDPDRAELLGKPLHMAADHRDVLVDEDERTEKPGLALIGQRFDQQKELVVLRIGWIQQFGAVRGGLPFAEMAENAAGRAAEPRGQEALRYFPLRSGLRLRQSGRRSAMAATGRGRNVLEVCMGR